MEATIPAFRSLDPDFDVDCSSWLRTRGWDVAAPGMKPTLVVPVHPVQCGQFQVFEVAPGPCRRTSSVLYKPITFPRAHCHTNLRPCQRSSSSRQRQVLRCNGSTDTGIRGRNGG